MQSSSSKSVTLEYEAMSPLYTLWLNCPHCLPHWYFSTLNSLITLVVIASLFVLLMNCSISLLSFCLYLYSAAFIHNLFIHSCMDSSFFLLRLQYCNLNVVLVSSDLNFWLNNLNIPSTISEFVSVCINCSTSLPSRFFMICTFPAPFISYALVWSMFITSISKFSSSIYLSAVSNWILVEYWPVHHA